VVSCLCGARAAFCLVTSFFSSSFFFSPKHLFIHFFLVPRFVEDVRPGVMAFVSGLHSPGSSFFYLLSLPFGSVGPPPLDAIFLRLNPSPFGLMTRDGKFLFSCYWYFVSWPSLPAAQPGEHLAFCFPPCRLTLGPLLSVACFFFHLKGALLSCLSTGSHFSDRFCLLFFFQKELLRFLWVLGGFIAVQSSPSTFRADHQIH